MGKKKSTMPQPPGEPAAMDEVDGVRVGEEPAPGMRLRCICRGHQGTIGRIAWSPCGRFIASPSTDKTIRIWDANDGKCLALLIGHKSNALCAAWSTDGELLASAGQDGTVRIWDAKAFERQPFLHVEPLTKRIQGKGSLEVSDVAWSPDGSLIAVAAEDSRLRICSFGSAAEGRPESTPRLYNMLEASVDPKTKKHMSIRVHTREQKKAEEAWQGFHAWRNCEGQGQVPFFDINLA